MRLGWGDEGGEHQQMKSKDQAGGRPWGPWAGTLTLILSAMGATGGI